MGPEHIKCIEITCLHHPDDRSTYDLLSDHLKGLCRKGLINEKSQVLAGATYEQQMKQRLEESQVIILLVSRSFHREDYYNSPEMLALLKSCAEKGAYIWPIIVKPVYWEFTSFCEYEVFFGKTKTIFDYQPQDEAYRQIVEKIHDEVALMQAEACVLKGNLYRRQIELDSALTAYESSFGYVSNYPGALLEEGRVLRKQGRSEEARQCFGLVASYSLPTKQKNKSTESNNVRAHLMNLCSKGYALLELRKFTEACQTFQETSQQVGMPINSVQRSICAEAYGGEGNVYLQLAQRASQPMTYLEQALNAYKQAETLSSEKQKYLVKIGEVYRIMGDAVSHDTVPKDCYEQALSHCEQAILYCSDYAPAYVEKANILSRLHLFEEALTTYETALKLDHYEAHAHGERGYLLLQLNNTQEALSAFETALSLESNNTHYLYGKGRTFALLGCWQEALNAYEEAKVRGLKSTDLFIDRAAASLELGDVEYLCGQQEQAEHYYLQAFFSYDDALQCGVQGKTDLVFYGLGKVLFALHDWEGALQHYQNALSFAPQKADAYLGIGKTLLELGKIGDAFSYFQYAYQRCHHAESTVDEVDIAIAYGDAYYRLAGQPYEKGYYERLTKAQEYYTRAIQIRKHIIAYVGLGKTYAALYDHIEAIVALNKALELNSQVAECYFVSGQCHHKMGQPTEAYILYEKARHCGLDNVSLRLAQGEALLEMKSYFRAKEIFDVVIEQVPEKAAHAYCGKGVALHALGMIEEALQSFEEANRLDSAICSHSHYRHTLEDINALLEGKLRYDLQDAVIYKYKGDILRLLGDQIENAIEFYTLSIQYGNESADVYCCRGEAYQKLQEYRRAVKDYRKALDIGCNHRTTQEIQTIVESNIAQYQTSFLDKIAFWLAALRIIR